jgi:hypothetical protein
MRNRGYNTEYSSMAEKLNADFAEKWRKKYNFDLHRY